MTSLARSLLPLPVLAVLAMACGGQTSARPASTDSGADSAACPDGQGPLVSCQGGEITRSCCPAGAHCGAPEGFCDVGGGACVLGACPVPVGGDGGLVDASPGAACSVDSDCHKSMPDECTVCAEATLVCHQGACLCSCQVPD